MSPSLDLRLAWIALLPAVSCLAQAPDTVRLVPQLGHPLNVYSVRFSPDARYVITGGLDENAILWDRETGRELRRFPGCGSGGVAITSDGRLLSGGTTGARLWNIATGRLIRDFPHASAVTAVEFAPDGHSFASASNDHLIHLWNVESGSEIRTIAGHEGNVRSIAFTNDGAGLLTASDDHTARLWMVATGQELRHFQHDGDVKQAAFTSNNRYIVTASLDGTARLWDPVAGSEVRRFTGHTKGVLSLAFTPNGGYLITSGLDDTLRFWEIQSGKEVLKADLQGGWLAVSSDGHFLALSQVSRVSLIAMPSTRVARVLEGQVASASLASYSPDGHYLLVAGLNGAVRLWDVARSALVRTLPADDGDNESVQISPDSRQVLVASGKRARLFDLETGAEIHAFADSGRVACATFSRDGHYVITAGSDAHLWNRETGAEIRSFRGHSEALTDAALSPDGLLLLTSSNDRTARLWDVASGRSIRQMAHDAPVDTVDFSPDGSKFLTAGHDRAVSVWDTATVTRLLTIPQHNTNIFKARFSPDGSLIVTSGYPLPAARLWDANTGKLVRELNGHSDWVMDFSFSANGALMFTASGDRTARIWETATGRELADLLSFPDGGWAVTDPEGRYDASEPDDVPGLIWVAANEVIELAQLKSSFYTPGLLRRIMRHEQLPDVSGGIQRVKLCPEVTAREPRDGKLEIHLRNRGGGIGRVVVKVNGRDLLADARGPSPDPNAATADLNVNLAGAVLAPDGKNMIEIIAYDTTRKIASRGVSVPWTTPAQQKAPLHLYAVVAGVSEYANPALHLKYASKDAADVAAALRAGARRLFGDENVSFSVLSSIAGDGTLAPTKENFQRVFDEIAARATAADVLLVYLAGHGVARTGAGDLYYFLTREARSTDLDDDALRNISTISSQELQAWCLRVKALHVVIVLDTCAAGAASTDLLKLAEKRELSPDQIRAMALLKDSTGSHILMGSAADAVSYEAGRYGQGLLTYALLEGMKGAALEESGRVDVSGLFNYAQKRVEALAKGIGGIQRPLISSPKGETFPIGLLTDEDKRAIHLAAPKPRVLRVIAQDENDVDSLGLSALVRERLRQRSDPMAVVRGGAAAEPPLVYLDSVVDDLPGAIMPRVRYAAKGATLNLRITLGRDRQAAAVRQLQLPAADLAKAADEVAGIVEEELRKLPRE